jgi:hypothetical protein
VVAIIFIFFHVFIRLRIFNNILSESAEIHNKQ